MPNQRAVTIAVLGFVAAVAGIAALAASRSDDEPTVIAAVAPTTTTALAPTSVTTTPLPATTSTTEQPTTTGEHRTTTPTSEPRWNIEELGPAMIGVGEWVRLTDAPEDPDSECSQGWLGYLGQDGTVHRYEDLGKVGGVRLFNGTRGQDAIAYSCEESVDSVLIQGSAILPSSGVPEWQVFELGNPYFLEYFSFLGWRGDSFMGLATTGVWDEFVAFDTASGTIVPTVDLIGGRVGALDHGYDFVLPVGWNLTSTGDSLTNVTISAPSGNAWIRISSLEFAGDPEPFANSELRYSDSTDVPAWRVTDAENLRARRRSNETDLFWVFGGPKGTQYIHHREAGELDLIVEYFLADSASNSDAAVTHLAAELVRHYPIVP